VADEIGTHGGRPVLVGGADGPVIAVPQDAMDLIASTFGRATTVALPAGRLDGRFFDLRTGLAGEVMQKFVNYRVRLVVVGDISARTGASEALRDLVRESNRGDHIWFVADLDELDARFAARA
jgi:Domain of unknown function (DUF4180)